jgi:hypothetical protein
VQAGYVGAGAPGLPALRVGGPDRAAASQSFAEHRVHCVVDGLVACCEERHLALATAATASARPGLPGRGLLFCDCLLLRERDAHRRNLDESVLPATRLALGPHRVDEEVEQPAGLLRGVVGRRRQEYSEEHRGHVVSLNVGAE